MPQNKPERVREIKNIYMQINIYIYRRFPHA